jgi:threonine aldolase
MPPPPARPCSTRWPRPTGSTPPMTATNGAAARRRFLGPVRNARCGRLWVTTGTAANCLGLATLCPPTARSCATRRAYRGRRGRRARLLHPWRQADAARRPGRQGHPKAVEEACARIRADVHQVQPMALSITNATEYGLTYSPRRSRRWARSRARGARLPHGRGAVRQCRGVHRRPGRPDLARRGRRAVVRLRQEWRDERRGADLLRPRLPTRRCRGAAQARRAFAVQGPLSRRADCWRCSRAMCGSTMPAPPMRGAGAGRSGGAERLVYPVEANELFVRMTAEEAAALRRRASISTTGARRGPAGHQLGPGHGRGRQLAARSRRCDGTPPAARRDSIVIPFIIFTGIWGSTWIVIRDQLGTVPPQWSVTYRFVIAATAMAAVAKWKGQRCGSTAAG